VRDVRHEVALQTARLQDAVVLDREREVLPAQLLGPLPHGLFQLLLAAVDLTLRVPQVFRHLIEGAEDEADLVVPADLQRRRLGSAPHRLRRRRERQKRRQEPARLHLSRQERQAGEEQSEREEERKAVGGRLVSAHVLEADLEHAERLEAGIAYRRADDEEVAVAGQGRLVHRARPRRAWRHIPDRREPPAVPHGHAREDRLLRLEEAGQAPLDLRRRSGFHGGRDLVRQQRGDGGPGLDQLGPDEPAQEEPVGGQDGGDQHDEQSRAPQRQARPQGRHRLAQHRGGLAGRRLRAVVGTSARLSPGDAPAISFPDGRGGLRSIFCNVGHAPRTPSNSDRAAVPPQPAGRRHDAGV